MAGLALAVTGATVLSLLVFMSNCSGDVCDQWTIRVGLAGSALTAMFGMAAIVIGGWLVWRGYRSGPQA